MVVFFALLYALGSMALGGMLILARLSGGYSVFVLWGNALGQQPWNYPGLLIEAPWGIVELPFLATWSMLLVSVGVGIGISVGLLIAVRLIRERRRAASTPGTVASIAGLTPAMIALVTLGACCSTTAAATAGVGLVAQASGSSVNNLLVNNWYLDVFQVTVVLVALLAQELVLEVYGGLLGLGGISIGELAPAPPRVGRGRYLAGGALRAALLIAGVTWSLSMMAEWTTVNPASAGVGLWFQWIVLHQVVAFLAILTALFPRAVADWMTAGRSVAQRAVRGLVLLAGAALVGWLPPVAAGAGVAGFGNELLGALGLPASWGAVPPAYAPGLALFLRWGFQYLLLGGFAVAAALTPDRAFRPVRWSLGRAESDSTRDSVGPLAVAPPSSSRHFPGADGPPARVDVPVRSGGIDPR